MQDASGNDVEVGDEVKVLRHSMRVPLELVGNVYEIAALHQNAVSIRAKLKARRGMKLISVPARDICRQNPLT